MRQLQNTLYITNDNIKAKVNRQAFEFMENDGTDIMHVPVHEIEKILVFGNNNFDENMYTKCAELGVGLYFFTANGKLRYRIESRTKGNVVVRKQQYLLSETQGGLGIASSMISGKIQNCIYAISRFMWNHAGMSDIELDKARKKLEAMNERAMYCADVNELRGIEGSAGRIYYDIFDKFILVPDERLHFSGRNRRPPKDCCNALLSNVYTMLMVDYISAIESSGLDSYVGFMHGDRSGKPSLALDMMEELRPAVADRFALKLINLRQINADMFEENGDGILLNKEGRNIVFREWNKMKRETTCIDGFDENVPFGLIPFIQAQQLNRLIRGETTSYIPIYRR